MAHIDPHSASRCATPAGAVGRIARRQHGVVARSQLLALGFSRGGIDAWVARERLCVVHFGVYAVGHEPLGRHGLLMAAVLACGPGAVVSHRSAEWLWDLRPDNRPVVDVTAPTHRRHRTGIVVHESRLADEDRTCTERIPVTSLARTLLDLAAREPRDRLARDLEQAERLRRFDLADVEAAIARANGHHGVARLREALADLREPPPVTRSELERRFVQLIRESGLPLPSFNANLHGYEVDALWECERVVVELDGYEYHRTRRAFERDRRRDAAIAAAGYRVLRFSWRQVVEEPWAVLAALRSTLTQA